MTGAAAGCPSGRGRDQPELERREHRGTARMAAVAFASLLVVIMRSDEVRGILTDLVRRALTVQ